ncbi:MAG: hypothetical protein ACREI3_12530, partial [Nitrospirales bacterium]
PWVLPCPRASAHRRSDELPTAVEIQEGHPAVFEQAARFSRQEDWFTYRLLQDGSDYLCWTGLFQFLVSPDGCRITGQPLNGASHEAFQSYLLSQVLSFTLIKQGLEPLHATVFTIGNQAVALVGPSGSGKSTLGAALLAAGHRLVTDDLLVLTPLSEGFLAQPGPPRIKLFPKIARSFWGQDRIGSPMNPGTTKRIVPLRPAQTASWPVPLCAIYLLGRPRRPGLLSPRLRRLPPRSACLRLIGNTFNAVIHTPARLRRQLALAAELTRTVPVKALAYPRSLARIRQVVEAIEKDVSQ